MRKWPFSTATIKNYNWKNLHVNWFQPGVQMIILYLNQKKNECMNPTTPEFTTLDQLRQGIINPHQETSSLVLTPANQTTGILFSWWRQNRTPAGLWIYTHMLPLTETTHFCSYNLNKIAMHTPEFVRIKHLKILKISEYESLETFVKTTCILT